MFSYLLPKAVRCPFQVKNLKNSRKGHIHLVWPMGREGLGGTHLLPFASASAWFNMPLLAELKGAGLFTQRIFVLLLVEI